MAPLDERSEAGEAGVAAASATTASTVGSLGLGAALVRRFPTAPSLRPDMQGARSLCYAGPVLAVHHVALRDQAPSVTIEYTHSRRNNDNTHSPRQ
eukprot:COSAG05_NODE_3535_length_2005_cov_1.651626_1_plen_95_part_10